jgi:phosphate transport system permease protein
MNSATRRIAERLEQRHAAEMRFRAWGVLSLLFCALMLGYLLWIIALPGLGGFTRHELKLDIAPSTRWGGEVDDYALTHAALAQLAPRAPKTTADRRALYQLVGFFAADDVRRARLAQEQALAARVKTDPNTVLARVPFTVWVPLSDTADALLKGRIDRQAEESLRPISDAQLALLDAWGEQGRLRRAFNHEFFTRGDSRAPEAAGFLGSMVGSLLMLAVCIGVALPVSIMAAIYLEEFAPKNRATELLEVVINNLAAVPSIIYGLLGLSVYLQWFGMPRSAPIVGALTLALLILPVMIIAARAAIRAVPPSLRLAALGLGASPIQAVRHHVLPYALPGIMTGTILSIARAIGETAPLLLIGMVAFVADVPRGLTDPATAMPVQIYLWASSPEVGFAEKTSAGILVLLAILLLLNATAIIVRKRTQQSW